TRYHLPIVIKVGSKYVIIEATPKIWKNLIESKRVYLEWKCQRFGHLANNCVNETKCTKFSGDHESNECSQNELKCSNCSWLNQHRNQSNCDINHRANDRLCPQYIKALARAQEKYRNE
ncbi:hypothetical protein BLOT_015640, partial [Blomia tropicalis]